MRRVVVGVDGSVPSLAALTWAVDTAGEAGTVVAVHAAARPPAATGELDRWVGPLRRAGYVVESTTVDGDPVEALLHVADDVDADLIAVGVHGRPRLAPRTLGHVVRGLVRRTERPIAVVGEDPAPPISGGSTVVAGVGHGAATRAALEWATRFADRRGTALSLIHAVPTRPVFRSDGLLDVVAYYIDPSALRRWANDDLATLADEIQRSTEHELPISWSAPVAAAGPTLVEASTDAALLVIGRHRRGPLAGHALTRALHHAITHAPCPVIIVPGPVGANGADDDGST